MMKRKKVSSIVVLILVLCIFAAFTVGCGGGSSRKKDGVNGCKNCGRSPVYAIGFCRDCYEGFIDYTYGK